MKLLSTLSGLVVFVFAASVSAQEKLPDSAKIVKLEAQPATIALTNPFAYAQIVVTAHLEGGETADVTRIAKITSPATIATVSPTGMARPKGDGAGTIAIELGGLRQTIAISVSRMKEEQPVGFVKDVQPVLSKLGCNAGTCHGSAQGKVGFKLSLRGYDPIFDHRALTDDLEGRRFNRAAPERSLMLMKPAGAVPHAGGVLTSAGEPYYDLVHRWIMQGVKLDLDAQRVKSLELSPKDPTVARIGMKQQFAVHATYGDGTIRDVTAEAFIETSNGEVAAVDKAGLLTSVRRGEATLLARYEGAYAASTVVVMGDRTGFDWVQQPVYNRIDDLVDQKLRRIKVQVSPICTDDEFIRRVSLDLTGLPPTPEEVLAFLTDTSDSRLKREKLVDRLVGSDAYVEHWSNRWADLLQVNRKFLGEPGANAFRKWVRDAVAANKPYDAFAYEILTATGSNVTAPPASYYKVLRTPDAVMENTTQLFLAVRFNCNKCHDHPFERWTQDNYFQLAAYFGRVERKEDPKFKGQKIGGTAVEGAVPLVELIGDAAGGEIKHERTGDTAAPKFPFAIKGDPLATDSRRIQAAKWITSPQNPYFARSYVNRVWSYLLGMGIIEPIDDIRAGNPASNPALLDELTAEFVASGFDAQKLIRTICKSRTYQLSIATNKWNKDDDGNYSHGLARRLPAEVLYDAIHRVTGSVSHLPGLPPGSRASQLPDSNVDLPGGFLDLFGKPVRESACECERSAGMNLGPVLAMVNGPVLGDAIKDPNNRIGKLVQSEKDDGKVVDSLYLAVLNRFPTSAERSAGVQALYGSKADHAALLAEYEKKKAAYNAYLATAPAKQKAYEDGLRSEKPTAWTILDVEKAESKHGPAPATGTPGATLTVQKDGAILVSGKTAPVDTYFVGGVGKVKGKVTAVRLEVFADPTLPNKGPGRAAENGNFVLNEFRLSLRAADKPNDKHAAVKLVDARATFQQDGYAVASAIDGNPTSGWALAPQTGKDQAALFRFSKPVDATEAGLSFAAEMEHRFGSAHTVGKFRLSFTTDPNPKLGSSLTPEQSAVLDTPVDKRTPEQSARLHQMYVAQDKEYQRLAAEAGQAPPTDARVLGAQDLVWALMNSPAFQFNH